MQPYSKADRPSSTRQLAATVFGTLLLFITFTGSIFGGATGVLFSYAPLALACLLLLNLSDPRRSLSVDKRPFLVVSLAIFLACLSVDGLQYAVVFTVFVVLFLVMSLGPLMHDLPRFAYYAGILNLGLYYSEIVLVGQLGLSFDSTIFNYAGAGREELTSTWSFIRYAGHHSEPGYLASNLTGLAVLSLFDGRRPGVFHWLCVVTLGSTLSLSAMILAGLLTLSLLVATGLSLSRLVVSTLIAAGVGVIFLQVAPLLNLEIVDYLIYRLQTRGGTDGSIYVKQWLLEDLLKRTGWPMLFGSRHDPCDYCSYARSLGFGFYMLFQGGLSGAAALGVMLWLAVQRLGRLGLVLFVVLILTRVDFFLPSAVFMILVIATANKGSGSFCGHVRTAVRPRWRTV